MTKLIRGGTNEWFPGDRDERRVLEVRGMEDGFEYRGSMRQLFCSDETILYFDCGSGHMNLYMC